jgi:peroxiredoxin Q/BCP
VLFHKPGFFSDLSVVTMHDTLLLWVLGSVVVLAVAVLFEERHGLLEVGAKAPGFTVTRSDGMRVSLKDYAGKKNVVLFFYPEDFTPGCTRQVCSLRDGYAELSKHDAVVFGVSDDGSDAHDRFREEYDLPFDLIADVDRSLIKAFGAGRCGGFLKSTKRVTYVIDKQGTIRLVAHHELAMGEHVKDVVRTLQSLELLAHKH